jgi:hypothetical protein
VSSFKFTFDEREFRRSIEKEVTKAVEGIARDRTRDLDAMRRQYTGRPIAEIKPALQRVFAKDGGSITDPELTEWAQAISDGTRIEFHADRIRWR